MRVSRTPNAAVTNSPIRVRLEIYNGTTGALVTRQMLETLQPNQYLATRKVELPDYYWLDRYEVTNREFKEFVDRGGYRKREYWKHPFEKSGRVLDFDEAMALFRDTTGRPGPSTWELGDYPRGQADFPVGGVSWYEAVAYAEFAGKNLPTLYHWYKAAEPTAGLYIIPLSNFG